MNSSINLKNSLLILVAAAIGVWVTIVAIKGIPAHMSLMAFKEIPSVAGYLSIGIYVFSKWLWKYSIFQGWLVTVPDLNGTWYGNIQTTWVDPSTGQVPGPSESFLVVRQTLTKIHFSLITQESKSSSRAEGVLFFPDSNKTIIEFTYQNNPSVLLQNRSNIHDGAVSLELTTTPDRRLTGKYWTDRNTQGQMDFKYHSTLHREIFAS